jgi:hypothetical protein
MTNSSDEKREMKPARIARHEKQYSESRRVADSNKLWI